eukprot:scaffold153819_cov18-Tisochrysis_lutea.AAC.1
MEQCMLSLKAAQQTQITGSAPLSSLLCSNAVYVMLLHLPAGTWCASLYYVTHVCVQRGVHPSCLISSLFVCDMYTLLGTCVFGICVPTQNDSTSTAAKNLDVALADDRIVLILDDTEHDMALLHLVEAAKAAEPHLVGAAEAVEPLVLLQQHGLAAPSWGC